MVFIFSNKINKRIFMFLEFGVHQEFCISSISYRQVSSWLLFRRGVGMLGMDMLASNSHFTSQFEIILINIKQWTSHGHSEFE